MNLIRGQTRFGAFTKALVLASLALALCEAIGADRGSAAMVGVWKLYKDDDRSDGPAPNELMSFWPSGKFRIAGDSPHQGLYRINGDQLQLLAKVGDRAIPIERAFELSGEQLRLKNRKTGWAHYQRVSERPQGEEPVL